MGIFSKKEVIVTHNGVFHADDIFSCAILSVLHDGNITIVRTRDPEKIASADYVVDVGGEHDQDRRRFDHHQKGGAGLRENGIPYASCGLVWKAYGDEICGNKELARKIDQMLIQPIDAEDNGMEIITRTHGVSPYTIQYFLYTSRPTWKETENFDEVFPQLVKQMKELLLREIKIASDILDAKEIVEKTYDGSADKRVIVFDVICPASDILETHPEPLYIVRPRLDGNWGIKAVRKYDHGFENRKDLPLSWAGLRDEELQKITGVSDAIFCHNGRFMAVAKTKDGALKLAQLALSA